MTAQGEQRPTAAAWAQPADPIHDALWSVVAAGGDGVLDDERGLRRAIERALEGVPYDRAVLSALCAAAGEGLLHRARRASSTEIEELAGELHRRRGLAIDVAHAALTRPAVVASPEVVAAHPPIALGTTVRVWEHGPRWWHWTFGALGVAAVAVALALLTKSITDKHFDPAIGAFIVGTFGILAVNSLLRRSRVTIFEQGVTERTWRGATTTIRYADASSLRVRRINRHNARTSVTTFIRRYRLIDSYGSRVDVADVTVGSATSEVDDVGAMVMRATMASRLDRRVGERARQGQTRFGAVTLTKEAVSKGGRSHRLLPSTIASVSKGYLIVSNGTRQGQVRASIAKVPDADVLIQMLHAASVTMR